MTRTVERTASVSEVAAYLAHLNQFAVMTGCLALTGLLVWFAGLLVVLHGSKPTERPAIIRAYAMCRPFALRFRSGSYAAAPQQVEDEDPASRRGLGGG
jgi:hypothetical protein